MKNEPEEDFQDDEDFDEKTGEKKEKIGYLPDLKSQSADETSRKSSYAMSAVINLVAAILIFLAIGWFLDRRLNTSPWLLLLGIIIGSILGFYQLVRISSKLNE
jgi:ATP synthase protein I